MCGLGITYARGAESTVRGCDVTDVAGPPGGTVHPFLARADWHGRRRMPRPLLDVDGLQKTLQGLCQWRVDSVFLRRNVIELAEDS